MLDKKMIRAWLAAARYLGVRVVAPYELRLPDGDVVEVEAFLPDFGGAHGTVVVPLHDDERFKRAAATRHLVSGLSDSYQEFEPDSFRETLDDWGWYGPSSGRPEWYTGKAWTAGAV
jgi:hypothetical protein